MRLGATLGIPRVAAVATLLLVVIVEGCAVTAETAGAARRPPPPLPVAELLLVGFGGTQVEGNEEVQSLVASQLPQLKFHTARTIVAGVLLAIAGLLLIIATHWGHFS